jgi:hypothetical protein
VSKSASQTGQRGSETENPLVSGGLDANKYANPLFHAVSLISPLTPNDASLDASRDGTTKQFCNLSGDRDRMFNGAVEILR